MDQDIEQLKQRAASIAKTAGTEVLPGWEPESGRSYDGGGYNYENVNGKEYLYLVPDPLCPRCGRSMENYPDYWLCSELKGGCGCTTA
jgi:hypothetical protein